MNPEPDFKPPQDDASSRPRKLPPEEADPEKFERNGWIGLIITLAGCLVAFILWAIFHKNKPGPGAP